MVSGAARHQIRGRAGNTTRIGLLTAATGSVILPTMSEMTPKATAQLVSVWRDEGLSGAALAENADSTGWNLIFQRAHETTEEDRQLGQDTYCLGNEAGTTVYGGVVRWTIAGSQLDIELDDRTSAELEVPDKMTIALQCGPAEMEEFGASLREILA